MPRHRLCAVVFATSVLFSAVLSGMFPSGSPFVRGGETKEKKLELSHFYGFREIEIFKLEERSQNMLSGDLNHDGLADLVLVDNSHSRIDLLQQRPADPNGSQEKSSGGEVNAVSNHWRFEHRKISVNKQITSLVLGDFNSDGRTDLAYFGVPDRLIVRYQPVDGNWTERSSRRLPDVEAKQWSLAGGDLNGDGKDDLAMLGKNSIYLVLQQADGKLAVPKQLMNTSNKLSLVQIADLDGDGRKDLCYLSSGDGSRFLCVRLQETGGQLGPELQFELYRSRSFTLADIDKKPGSEILSVDSQTGRVKVFQLKRPKSKPGELAGRLIQYGFGRQGAGRNRDLATGDLDGDGLTDVVVTDPAAAQMIVYRQQKDLGLDVGSTYPGLVDAGQVRLDDLDGDRRAEVIVLSVKEKTVALSRMKEGRLTFPKALPVVDDPLAIELSDLNGDGRSEILYISKKGRGRSAKYALRALAKGEKDGWTPFAFGDKKHIPLSTKSAPKRILRLDANRDGRADYLVFIGSGDPPLLLVTDDKGVPQMVTSKGGIGLGNVTPGSVFVGRLDEPVLLAAQKNFARNVRLDGSGRWEVVDQYNADESNAKIVGAATVDLDGSPGNEIVLVDTGIKKLRVLRREGSLFRRWREVEIGDFPYEATHVADLNGDSKNDLLLFGRGKFGVLYAGGTDPVLKEMASFETRLKRAYFADVAAGDLNADGHIDLAAIDIRTHFVEILNFDGKRKLQHALHFKLFEDKSFSRGTQPGVEPREVLIVDVTNDTLPDLVILVHDRVLVYPQDNGK